MNMDFLFETTWLSSFIRCVFMMNLVFGVFGYMLVWAERKVSAAIQDRIGPNRVGPMGLLQGMADGLKFVFKEDVRPAGANPFLFALAPALAMFPAMLAVAVVPMGAKRIAGELVPFAIANVDAGVLMILAFSSLGVFSLLLGGWASNSKFPILGGLRAAAQMISYEIPMGMTMMSVVLLAGSMKLNDIVQIQSEGSWFIFLAPLGFLLFIVSMFAETNRLPFDMPEGESEIVGFHAEYSGMKFAMFFLAEYANMFTVSCLTVLMFLGGWEFLPYFTWDKLGALVGVDILGHSLLWLVTFAWFMAKVVFFLFLFIWVRWTLPRFRYDQLMRLGWKRLIPLSMLNLILCLIVVLKGWV